MLTEERKARIKHKLFNVRHGFDTVAATNKAYQENKRTRFHELLRGKIDAAVLDAYPVFIDEDDLIAGHTPLLDASDATVAENEKARMQMSEYGEINGMTASSSFSPARSRRATWRASTRRAESPSRWPRRPPTSSRRRSAIARRATGASI